MSFGFQAINDSGIVNIDESSLAYVYLGKHGPVGVDGAMRFTVDVQCVGVPLIFFSVPHAFTGGEAYEASWGATWYRNGLCMEKLERLSSTTWRVHMAQANISSHDPAAGAYQPFNTELRVFGRLDLNFPEGSSSPFGMRVFTPEGRLCFDTGFRMLRLAGNTYDTEIKLDKRFPGFGASDMSDYAAYDTTVALPFSMAGKSICATARGTATYPRPNGGYFDVDSIYWSQYEMVQWGVGYWSNGNTLTARKVVYDVDAAEFSPSIGSVVSSDWADVFTRLSVIDNSQFP